MKKIAIMLGLACIASGPAFAEEDTPAFPSDNRMRLLPYDESDIYVIPTKYGYQTSIVFAPQEQIETISLGERSLWQIIPSGNRLFIRPMEENVTTNMTVLTDLHSYQFDLKSGSAKSDEVIYVAKFVYANPRAAARRSAPAMTMAPPAPPSMPSPPANAYVPYHEPLPAMEKQIPAPSMPTAGAQEMNYRYTFSGPDELAPLQVYDNGKSTFIRYRNMDQALPNAYVVEGGKESQVAYHVENEMMVIDKVAGELALKNSTGTVNVYNETLNPQ